jgi:hypothetical protein
MRRTCANFSSSSSADTGNHTFNEPFLSCLY